MAASATPETPSDGMDELAAAAAVFAMQVDSESDEDGGTAGRRRGGSAGGKVRRWWGDCDALSFVFVSVRFAGGFQKKMKSVLWFLALGVR